MAANDVPLMMASLRQHRSLIETSLQKHLLSSNRQLRTPFFARKSQLQKVLYPGRLHIVSVNQTSAVLDFPDLEPNGKL